MRDDRVDVEVTPASDLPGTRPSPIETPTFGLQLKTDRELYCSRARD
jgi:hypothetical protein